MAKQANTRLLGINLLVFSGIFTLLFVVYTLLFNSTVSHLNVAVIILGIMLIMVAALLVVHSSNLSQKGKAQRRKRR